MPLRATDKKKRWHVMKRIFVCFMVIALLSISLNMLSLKEAYASDNGSCGGNKSCSKSTTQEANKRNGFWGSLDLAVGDVSLSSSSTGDRADTLLYMGFSGGYSINPNFLIGVELSGWLYETSEMGNPSKGEGLSQVFITTRYYPFKENNLFARISGGYVSHWNNNFGSIRRNTGWGLGVGGGYDIAITNHLFITPFVIYNYGDLKEESFTAISVGVGITFY